MATPLHPKWILALFTALSMASLLPLARAQVQEEALKAAFVFNFASFTTWSSAEALPSSSLELCAFTAPAMHDALMGLADKHVKGRRVKVRSLREPGETEGCDVLVVDPSNIRGQTAAEATNDVESAGTSQPVVSEWWIRAGMLTILDGEDPSAPAPAACITLVREGDRIRFDVDATTAAAVGLDFSSRLLNLARRVW